MTNPDGSWKPPQRGSEGRPPIPDWLRALVRLMDSQFAIPGTNLRFGLDPLLGLFLPGAGDVVGGLVSLLLIAVAFQSGVPAVVLLRMLINVGVDALAGAVPLLGDLFDAAYHSNEKNLELLERHAEPGRKPTFQDYLVVTLVIGALLALLLVPVAIVVLLVKLAEGGG